MGHCGTVQAYVDVPQAQAQLTTMLAAATPVPLTPRCLCIATALTTAAFVHRYGGS